MREMRRSMNSVWEKTLMLTAGHGGATALLGKGELKLGVDAVRLALEDGDEFGGAAPDIIRLLGLLEVAVGLHLYSPEQWKLGVRSKLARANLNTWGIDLKLWGRPREVP